MYFQELELRILLAQYETTKIIVTGPLFKVTSGRARRMLDADSLVVLTARPETELFDFYIENSNKHDDNKRLYHELQKLKSDSWQNLINLDKPTIFNENTDDELLLELLKILEVSTLIIAPFVLENVSSGYAIWGLKSLEGSPKEILSKVELIAEQIALSLSASLNEQRSKEQGNKLAALFELSTSIYSSLNYTEVLEKTVYLAMEIVGANSGTIMLLNKEERTLSPITTIDAEHQEAISAFEIELGQGITGKVAETGVGVISNNAEYDPRAVQIPGTPNNDEESLISVPLTWSGNVIGTITLWADYDKQFVHEDLEILTIFARQAADAIENARLYEKLQSAYEELSATHEKLIVVEKLKALAEMAGGVAHDFNNILGTILGRVQLLGLKTDDPILKKEFDDIEAAAMDGRRTVKRLQDFTQVSAAVEYKSLDLNKIVARSIESTRPAWKDNAQRRGVTINMVTDLYPLSTISGNREELTEAISNVILNSIDALETSGEIKISTYMDDDKAVLKIADNGKGMDEETQNKLFFPFFSTKSNQKGSGMGLAVVYGIMFRHQADISVISAPNSGAEFIFTFNVVDDSVEESSNIDPKSEPDCLSILLVDDDMNLLEVVNDMIEYLGHKCKRAGGGQEALDLLNQQKFDMVVTDLGMPNVGGWEVAQHCRMNYPDTPIILISGWGAQIDENDVKDKVDAVLSKPFRIDEFKDTINLVFSSAKEKSSAGVSN